VTTETLLTCEIPELTLHSRGKVRDLYEADGALLFVATDRISAFDVIMNEGVPDKGKILTAISVFWLRELGVPNHLITDDVRAMPEAVQAHEAVLQGRALLVKRLKIIPVECVVRGYLAGSGLKSYRARGEICGVALPPGLREADRLPEPIFTPTTKATEGHDEEMRFEDVVAMIGRDRAEEIRRKSTEIYLRARDLAAQRGVILCDTKFEWGVEEEDGPAILGDEVLTPDSSRFWPGDQYEPGRSQPSFDKQFLRDWLEGLDWDKKPPPPPLPPEVIEGTRKRYVEIYERLTGTPYGDR
jgi:phosphoribosylaminoimidazole-succinocarboxamide synthase